MNNRNNRILWIINHTTLRNCEVPLLRDYGYEVFTSKIFLKDPNIINTWSADYQFDQYLTIPPELLTILNNHDFYNSPWPAKLTHKLNNYFGTIICACIPSLINHVVANFSGKILLRAFGLLGEKTYADLFKNYCDPSVLEAIRLNKHRIWFAQSYSNISLNEPQLLSDISITLPLGLPRDIYNYKETWKGTINKILFVCPRIIAIDYHREAYAVFKAFFFDIPHSIAGTQSLPVNDESVLGFVQEEQYRQLMQNYKVMFYHSREERHLHYHPLEALVYGMPLIFMADGLLDQISAKQLPGRCENYTEAKEKIQKILSGDTNFINEIKRSQKIILNSFSKEYIYEQWKTLFVKKVMSD